MNTVHLLGRLALTLAVLIIALFAGRRVWIYYEVDPWTRDGRVSADVVTLAPDVSGLVSEVLVHDNQAVRLGGPLFRVDRDPFRFALMEADAIAKNRLAALQEALRECKRYHSLTDGAVSKEKQEQTQAAVDQAAAVYQQAVADRDPAQLNLDRTTVKASVNGIVTSFHLQPGEYVSVGNPVTALVDTDSLHVDGYFEETKLPRIHVGNSAHVHLMGETRWLAGNVESIAGGIEDRERTTSGDSLLANVNPTFTWVRLAQRIPVRIKLNSPSPDIRLIVGRTATVAVGKSDGGQLSKLKS